MSVLIKHDPPNQETDGGPGSSPIETRPVSNLRLYGLLIIAGVVTLLWLLFLGWEIYRFVAWIAGA